MNFRPGDIGFVHNGAFISKIMSWAMGSKWSHTFMVIGDLHGETMVIETSDFEVTINTLRRYLDGRPLAIFRSKSAYFEESEVCLRAMANLGEIYGYGQLISLGIRRLLMKVGIKIPNFIRSGLVCCAVPLYGYQPILGIDPESIDTEECYQLIKSRFNKVHSTI